MCYKLQVTTQVQVTNLRVTTQGQVTSDNTRTSFQLQQKISYEWQKKDKLTVGTATVPIHTWNALDPVNEKAGNPAK